MSSNYINYIFTPSWRDIHPIIFGYLNAEDLGSSRRVSKFFKSCIDNDTLWEKFLPKPIPQGSPQLLFRQQATLDYQNRYPILFGKPCPTLTEEFDGKKINAFKIMGNHVVIFYEGLTDIDSYNYITGVLSSFSYKERLSDTGNIKHFCFKDDNALLAGQTHGRTDTIYFINEGIGAKKFRATPIYQAATKAREKYTLKDITCDKDIVLSLLSHSNEKRSSSSSSFLACIYSSEKTYDFILEKKALTCQLIHRPHVLFGTSEGELLFCKIPTNIITCEQLCSTPITCLSSYDETHVFAGCQDGTILFTSIPDAAIKATYHATAHTLSHLYCYKQYLLAVSKSTLDVWNVDSGNHIFKHSFPKEITSFDVQGQLGCFGLSNGSLYFFKWGAYRGQMRQIQLETKSPITNVGFKKNRIFASTSTGWWFSKKSLLFITEFSELN